MNTPPSVSRAESLAASLAALGRASHRSELLETFSWALQQHTHAHTLQITWLAAGGITSLLENTPSLPTPTPSDQALLLENQIVQHNDLAYLPMVVMGALHGWVTLQGAQRVEIAHPLVSQAGMALALFEHNKAQPALLSQHAAYGNGAAQFETVQSDDAHPNEASATHGEQAHHAHTQSLAELKQRNQQLATLVEIGNRLRATNGLADISDIIIEALQALTGTPRVLVYLTDPQREWVKLHTHVGLNADALMAIEAQVLRVTDAEQMLWQLTSTGQHFYRVQQQQPDSPFQDCALLVLSDQRHAPVGCAVFDLVNYAAPISAEFIQTLEVLANQAASALINARLMDQQQRTVNQLTALSAFSLAATSTSLSTAELSRMAVGGAVGTTQALGGGVLLRNEHTLTSYYETRPLAPCTLAIVALLQRIDDEAEYVEITGEAVPDAARAAGVGTLLCVPLRGTNLVLGHLWVAYGTPSVLPADREMVSLYAKTAGSVLENQHLFDQLRIAHDRLASILESTNDGLLMATASGEVLTANAALGRLLSSDTATLSGSPVDTLLKIIVQHGGDPSLLASALRHVAQDERASYAGELHLTAPDQCDLTWSVVPVHSGEPSAPAALLIMRDVTEEYRAGRLRQDLTHMVVHDLRAPLANIIASLDLLLKQRIGALTPRQERITQIASESSHHMIGLINALLDMRRMEHLQFELQSQPHRLAALAQEACEQFEQTARARGISLHHHTAALPSLLIDAEVIRRVLQNLVDNAIKFSPKDGCVRIEGSIAEDAQLPSEHIAGRWALVRVIDQGRGVPEEYRTHIFELFGQAPNGRSQGSGVGLAFCKLAVGAHGGMIWVTDAPDGGAAFCFTLPLA
jgi:signal transduction histidine kinase